MVTDGKDHSKGDYKLTSKLSGKRVGIVGLGRIGSAIAKRAEAFGCSIAYFSSYKVAALIQSFIQNQNSHAACEIFQRNHTVRSSRYQQHASHSTQ